MLPSLSAWKFLHSLIPSFFCERITSSPEEQCESTGLHEQAYSSLCTSGVSILSLSLYLCSSPPLHQHCCRAGSTILYCTHGLLYADLYLTYRGKSDWHRVAWKAHSRAENCNTGSFSHLFYTFTQKKRLTAVRRNLLLYRS